jgi:TolB protein
MKSWFIILNKRIWSKPVATRISIFWAVILLLGVSAAQGPITIAYQVSHTINMDTALSPDGKRMVYISVISGKEQFFTMNIDGSDSVQLTHDDADHEDPAWSPDGTKIAFVLIKGSLEQIFLMSADGSGAEPLTSQEVRAIHPSWSADSKKVAYCTDDDLKPPKKNDSDIYAIDLGNRLTTKIITGGVNTYPVWSADGSKMAFRRMLGDTNSEVFVANSDGSGAHNVTNNPAFDGWPEWSPDGKQIAFASNRSNSNYQIYLMDAEGGNVRKVAGTEGRATAPKWAKDGKTIYFSNCKKVDFTFNCEVYAAKLDAFPK